MFDAAFYAARLIAETCACPAYAVWPAPTPAPTSKQAPPPFFGFRPARSILGRIRDRVVHAMVERSTRNGMQILAELRRREGLAPYVGSVFDLHVATSRRIFQIGVPSLDFPRTDWPANLEFIGALLPYRRPTASASLPFADKLERYGKAVVVSQGTVDNRDPDKLFVPTLEALAGTNRLVVATTGGRHTEALRRRYPQDNVVIEDWIDFHTLLENAALFVCNGWSGDRCSWRCPTGCRCSPPASSRARTTSTRGSTSPAWGSTSARSGRAPPNRRGMDRMLGDDVDQAERRARRRRTEGVPAARDHGGRHRRETAGPPMMRAAALCAWSAALGFGLPGLYETWYLAAHDRVWSFLNFPTYGSGPLEHVGVETTTPLLLAFMLVCSAELVVGWMLWRRTRAAVASLTGTAAARGRILDRVRTARRHRAGLGADRPRPRGLVLGPPCGNLRGVTRDSGNIRGYIRSSIASILSRIPKYLYIWTHRTHLTPARQG